MRGTAQPLLPYLIACADNGQLVVEYSGVRRFKLYAVEQELHPYLVRPAHPPAGGATSTLVSHRTPRAACPPRPPAPAPHTPERPSSLPSPPARPSPTHP
jgi:hypothetical protein